MTPTPRDVLAAVLWAAIPLGFVLGIDALGIPYEPLEGAPEKDPSYAIVMYALIALGGALGSLFGLGTWLIPGRLLTSDDFRVLARAALGKASAGEIEERGKGRLVRAALAVIAAFVLVVATLLTSGRVFVPVLAALGLAVLFGLALFGSTAQRAARRGHDPRQWMALPGEPTGEDALALVRAGPGVAFSRFVWRHALVWFLVIVAGGTVLDQATKMWAQQNLAVLDVRNDNVLVDGRLKRMPVRKYFNHPPSEVHIIPNALSFKYAENPAAAFSLTGNLPEWIRRPFLVGTSTLAMLFIGLWFFLNRRPDGLLMTAFALIMAGALGNLIDRIRFGYVIDFINAYAGFIDPRYIWPTFNVADMCIVGGALSVVLRTLRPLYPEPAPDEGDEAESAAEGRATSEATGGGA